MAEDKILEGLLYTAGASAIPPETRTGIPLYNGSPHGFDEWKFRVMTKYDAFTSLDVDEA